MNINRASTYAFSTEAFLGYSLALILLTGSRYANGVGLGEIGLALYIVITLGTHFFSGRRRQNGLHVGVIGTSLAYLFLVLLPVTSISIVADVPGASLRDFAAYAISFLLIYSVSVGNGDVNVVNKVFVTSLLLIITYKYLFGGFDAWYGGRFSAGAANPNQLALFIVCGILVSTFCFRSWLAKVASIGGLLIYGMLSQSDAFHLYLVFVFLALIGVWLFRKEKLAWAVLLLLLATTTLLLYEGSEIFHWFASEWSGADDGDSRLPLYVHGVQAWLSSPFTTLFGNGAGSYSGPDGPFGGWESHDTPIDMLSIGGVIGFYVLFRLPFRTILRAYSLRRLVLFSCGAGVIVFSLFHFVARHPIFWFSLFSLSKVLETPRQIEGH